MHEAFDPGFQLHKGTVGHEVDHLALDLGAHGVLALDELPRVLSLLLEAEGDALLLFVDVQHDHVELLADGHHFARVINTPPAHVGDVQQAVEAVEVDEGTEVGDVLHLALDHGARGEVVQHLDAFCGAFLLDQFAAGKHNVLSLCIQLHDLELHFLADESIEVFRLNNVHLGTG